ncbi:helix-turn-helix domain-containing protein [Citromicrobium bathyomarinum]
MALLDEYLNREQLAHELKVNPRTVMRWQNLPDGLPFVELGGRILYRRSSVMEWIASKERFPNQRRRAAA